MNIIIMYRMLKKLGYIAYIDIDWLIIQHPLLYQKDGMLFTDG